MDILALPTQDLKKHSLFKLQADAVSSWAESLPRANMGEMAKHVYKALSELNRVQISAAKRLALLEILRPQAQYVQNTLQKHFLNQPLNLPPQASKIANLANAIFELLAMGYRITTLDEAAELEGKLLKNYDTLTLANHRAITELNQLLLHRYRLHQSVKPGFWMQLHQLYLIAKKFKLTEKSIPKNDAACEIAALYKKAILITCAKPNQLRQEDFTPLSKLLESWCQRVSILEASEPQSEQALFVVNTDDDTGPSYRELIALDQKTGHTINTAALIAYLERIKTTNANVDGSKVSESNIDISMDLLNHIMLSWSTMTKRTFMRLEADESLELCVGLSATQFNVSGSTDFTDLTSEATEGPVFAMEDDNPFLRHRTEVTRNKKDVWDSPYTENVGKTDVALESIEYHLRQQRKKQDSLEKSRQNQDNKFEQHSIQMINVSPGGYCLKVTPDTNIQIKTGEIVGLREVHHKNWNIGIVRWASHEDKRCLIGIELISPNAEAFGARIVRSAGAQTEFMRALLLPENKLIGQSTSLITPCVPFKEGQKVSLVQKGKKQTIQLTKQLSSTPAIKQFEFRYLVTSSDEKDSNLVKLNLKSKIEDKNDNEDFGSLWKDL